MRFPFLIFWRGNLSGRSDVSRCGESGSRASRRTSPRGSWEAREAHWGETDGGQAAWGQGDKEARGRRDGGRETPNEGPRGETAALPFSSFLVGNSEGG